jgi:hypothetical protein
MKLNPFLNAVGMTGGIATAVFLYVKVARLQEETQALKISLNKAQAQAQPAAAPEPIELADVMAKLQRHANKLYFSGARENWELAAFYVEEIEETVEEIEKKQNVMHGQINVSGLMPALLQPEIEKLEACLKRKDLSAFREQYQALMASCNSCHQAAGKPYIVIAEPHNPAYDNQRFEPVSVRVTAHR